MTTLDIIATFLVVIAGSYLSFNAIRIHINDMRKHIRAYDTPMAVSSCLQAVFTVVLYVLVLLILAHQV